MRYAFISLLFIFLSIPESNADAPRESLKYKRELIRQSRIIWGLDAPIPLFASQIHQESTWNHLAKSKYAKGLTQFTDSTAEWMIEIFPQLKRANVYNPNWSIRAMLLYDSWLDDRIKSIDECNQWAMILSSYNGGLTWLNRDKELTEKIDAEVMSAYKEAVKHGDLANGPFPPASTIFSDVYEEIPWHIQEQREELGK